MGYEALLFCPDEKTARTVTQVLSELEFNVEACLEPFAAVKKLMGQHFDAVVVDCDNEQNATLLFKSARNSTSNQASLAVAVVEGQAGVAKAFRIGANLVLTKPINIEQSKGTLRVARGLLRKGEPPKPAAAAPAPGTTTSPAAAAPAKPVAAKPVIPARPPVTAKPAAVSAPRPAVPPAAKPVAKPLRPAVPAATTSVPAAPAPAAHSPVPAAVHSAASPAAPQEVHPEVPQEDLPEISAENPAAAPAVVAAPALTPSARIAALPPRAMKLPVPAVASAPAAAKPASSPNVPATLGSGAASAPAPAREAEPPHAEEISLENAVTSDATLSKPETDSPADKTVEATASDSGYVGAAPAFTFGGANVPEEKTGKSKKPFLAVAAVVLVGAALYYGWTQYKSSISQPEQIPAATRPAPAAPKPATPNSVPAASSTAPGTATDSASLPGSQSGASPATSQNDDDSPDATTPASAKPAGATGDKTGSDKTGSDKTAPSKPGPAKSAAAPLLVKGGTAPTLRAAAPAPDAPAPSITGIAVAGASAPPLNLGNTTSVPKPVLQTVSISQGVSRGLLIHQVSPIYPKAAITMRIEGTVELTTTISKTGDITHVKIVSGDAQLAKAAADAVKQWKYKPYLLNGEPVDIQTSVTVNFKLPQ